MAAQDAVDFLITDHGDKDPPSGFRQKFAADEPYKSVLQRNGKSLEELLEIFDWSEEDNQWVNEYNKPKGRDKNKLIRLRRAVGFLVSSWREGYEDLGEFDVSCLRRIRTPYVTSRTPLKVLRKELEK